MAQNIKIVLSNVEKQTPNNVGFSDTITIKGNSKIALTGFNASFDINKLGQDILGQSFILNVNKTLYDSPRTITIPDNTYYNKYDLMYEIMKQMNNGFSAYEKDAPADQKRVFNGVALIFQPQSQNDDKKITIMRNTTQKTPHSFTDPTGSYLFRPDNDYLFTEEGSVFRPSGADMVIPIDAQVSLDAQVNASTPFLAKGGGTYLQYNIRFNLKNLTLTSSMGMKNQRGDEMVLHYNTEADPAGPILFFYCQKKVNGVLGPKETITNDFFDWDDIINADRGRPAGGPWRQTDATKTASYFLWCVRGGKWIIVYFDANDSSFHEVYTDGLTYEINDNYTFEKAQQQPTQEQVVFYPSQTFGTFQATEPLLGSNTSLTTFNFENAPRLREIFSFSVVAKLIPENNFQAIYVPNADSDFLPVQDFEIACEIDTIKIKNYVGTKGNVGSGRKNIIAYFTPEASISQSSFIYRFDPSNPIYLAVDSKEDITFNSLNIRFINTYSNKTFSADTITCVLTNSP